MTMQHLTEAQIKARLSEIEIAQERHSARDLDAELHDLMRKGGDIDALETAQLEAERGSRRLQIEKAALETELPEARKRAGAVNMAVLAKRHDELAVQAESVALDVASSWKAFAKAVDRWESLQRNAMELSHEGAQLHHQTGAGLPQLGYLNSNAIVRVLDEFGHNGDHARRVRALHAAQSAVDTSAGRFQRPLTGEAA